MITISDSAKTKIEDILYNEGNPNLGIRISIYGGGCAGFSYQFQIENQQNEDDFVIEIGQFRVLIDHMSAQYLTGAVVDFQETLMDSKFVINNPNAQTSCGCGASFSV